jgi:hypothetical protein
MKVSLKKAPPRGIICEVKRAAIVTRAQSGGQGDLLDAPGATEDYETPFN